MKSWYGKQRNGFIGGSDQVSLVISQFAIYDISLPDPTGEVEEEERQAEKLKKELQLKALQEEETKKKRKMEKQQEKTEKLARLEEQRQRLQKNLKLKDIASQMTTYTRYHYYNYHYSQQMRKVSVPQTIKLLTSTSFKKK